MTTYPRERSPLFIARLAGFLYFLVIPLGIFGGLYVFSKLIVPEDPAATASNLMASESFFRLGIVSEMLAPIFMVLVASVLYNLLEPVSKTISLFMVSLVLVAASIAMLNKLNQFAALLLLGEADYLTVFTTEQLQALALFFLRLHSRGASIAFVFWGLWLLPLGYLVVKSGFFPRILGILLIFACCGYLIDSFASFLGYSVNIGLFAAVGEVVFILWLLIKGVDAEQWHRRALASV